jgi:GNAT superfamily N-acetyltransferase
MPAIHPITVSDRDDWLELWTGYLAFYETILDEATTESTFSRITDADSDIHGAMARDSDGNAIGLVHWLTHPSTWTQSDYCYLEDLFVAPDSRGAGAGSALIDHVREWAHQHGSAKLYWLTAESNLTAQALYDRVAARSGFIQFHVEF